MLIFIDLGDNTSENNSFNPRTNFVLHSVINLPYQGLQCWHVSEQSSNHCHRTSLPDRAGLRPMQPMQLHWAQRL